MSDNRKTVRLLWGSGVASLLLAVAALQLAGATAHQPGPAPDQFVGSDTCLACHQIHPGFFRTPHAALECESCHGPGEAHVESGGDDRSIGFGNRPPARFVEACLSCHAGNTQLAAFRFSEHGRGGIACGACHRLHPEEPVFGLLSQRQLDLCSSCHPAVRASFQKPFHHPVLEGAVACGDCHDPHAGDQASLRRFALATEQSCVSCHPDKNGPFVFEHAPLEVTNCQSCHEPHGSINARMLRRTRVQQLCLECHSRSVGVAGSQPPAFHDVRSPRFQNCTTCHREIHGSNVSPLFLR